MRSRLALPWMVAVLVVLGACDPAFDYRPVNLRSTDDGRWIADVGDVEIQADSLGGFISSTGLIPTFDLVNRSGAQASIEGAELIIGDESYPADLPGAGELRWRSVNPGESGSISLHWEFDRSAIEVLGEQPELLIDLRIGEELRRVEIDYERVQ